MKNNLIEIDLAENIQNLIYTIRGQQVMLDSDLASIYGYEVKRLNEQVKRNVKRFPEDFMFQLTKEELNLVKSQIATSPNNNYFSGQDGGRRKLPYAFTEQGIYMLATVLKGEVAEKQSIYIMRLFREMKRFLNNNQILFSKISKIELKQLEADKKFEEIFNYIASKQEIKQKIFFDGQIYDAFSLIVEIIQKAKTEIILIDNYVDTETLNILSKRKDKIKIKIYTNKKTKLNKTEINKFNAQYKNLSVDYIENFHDRFLILDKNLCYHIGASIKDLGKKSFGINKIEDEKNIKDILNRL